MKPSLVFVLLSAVLGVPLFTPLQIVKPNGAHTGFEVVKETLAQLTSLGRSKKIAIISVVGPYHSGKSFLLNALIGKTDVFSVGPKTSPETMGLWIARTNITMGSSEVWFLDSEGFFGPQVPETYDAKTFSLALLLGDEFVYNTVKIIDSQAVNLLEMLARRAQLFRVKTEAAISATHGLKLTPHLTWVVEDFVQASEDGQSKTRWLEGYLTSDGVDQPYLKKIFPDLSVKSLFLPATSRHALTDLSKVPFSDLTAEFRSDLSNLRDSIFARLKDRSNLVSAPELAQSIQFLAGALDKGLFPELPSLWQSWKHQVIDSSLKDAVELFDTTLRKKIDVFGASESIPSVDEFNAVSCTARNESLIFFSELVVDFLPEHQTMTSLVHDLETQLKQRHETSLDAYLESIKIYLKEKSRSEFSKFLQLVPSAYQGHDLVEPSVLQSSLGQLAVGCVEELSGVVGRFDVAGIDEKTRCLPSNWLRAGFPEGFKTKHPVDDLRMELQNQIDSLLVENDKGIANVVKSSAITAIKSVDDVVTNASSTLMSGEELEKFNQKVIERALTLVFVQELGRPWMRSISPLYEDTTKFIQKEIQLKLNQFKAAHEERLYEWFRKNSEKALSVYRDMKRTIEVSRLPLDESDLVREHTKAVSALVTSLDEDLGGIKFNASSAYRETRSSLNNVVETELVKLKRKNIELWKVHSDEATQCAFELNAQYVNMHCPQGWFCWFKVWPGSHRSRSWEHLMQCFGTKQGGPSQGIQNQIFDSWYEKELAKEVAEVRSNMWIAMVSVLVPIAWILYIKRV